MNKLYVVATSKPWNSSLPELLNAKTGNHFKLVRDPHELTDLLSEFNPLYIFFPHWSHYIPKAIFQNFECVVFHMTDLPFGRGGSPLQNLIARGIYETQVTAFKCVDELDAGPIYLKHPLSLYGTAEEIYLRASKIVESMVMEITTKNPTPFAQIGESTFFARRNPEQSNFLYAESLEQAFDHIRMLDADGYPNAFVQVGNFRFEFTRASIKTNNILADVKITLIDKKQGTANGHN